MKKAYRANKSKEIFYVDYEGEQEVTLRNPMTGVVKTIKGTTLKRSYTLLTQEELKMEHETIVTEQAVAEVALDFRELLDCVEKCHKVHNTNDEYKGAIYEIKENEFEMKGAYETREIEVEYYIWFKTLD